MNLHISALYVRDRKSGKTGSLPLGKGFAFAANLTPGADVSAVAAAHERLRDSTPEGAELRAKYSHALFIVDNVVRASYVFPDPQEQERAASARKLTEARRQLAAAEAGTQRALEALEEGEQASKRADDLRAEIAALEQKLGIDSSNSPTVSGSEGNGGQSTASTLPPGESLPGNAPHSEVQPSGFVPSPETGANGPGDNPAQPAVKPAGEGLAPDAGKEQGAATGKPSGEPLDLKTAAAQK